MVSYGIDPSFNEHVSQHHPDRTLSIFKKTSGFPHKVLTCSLVYPTRDCSKAEASFERCLIHKLEADSGSPTDSAWINWQFWACRDWEHYSKATKWTNARLRYFRSISTRCFFMKNDDYSCRFYSVKEHQLGKFWSFHLTIHYWD